MDVVLAWEFEGIVVATLSFLAKVVVLVLLLLWSFALVAMKLSP